VKFALLAVAVLAGVAVAAPTLDAKHADALHRALAKQPDAQRLLVPATCTRTAAKRYTCFKRGCARDCMVIEASAKVRLRNGVVTAHDVNVKRLGDTGQCGFCMSVE
jgi:hypothetical protein